MNDHISVDLGLLGPKILRIYDQVAHFDLACAHHARPRNVLKKVPSGARSSPWFISRQNSVMTNVLDAQSYICGLTIARAKILRIYDDQAHFDLACVRHARPRSVLKTVLCAARNSPWFWVRRNSVTTNVLDAQPYICGLGLLEPK